MHELLVHVRLNTGPLNSSLFMDSDSDRGLTAPNKRFWSSLFGAKNSMQLNCMEFLAPRDFRACTIDMRENIIFELLAIWNSPHQESTLRWHVPSVGGDFFEQGQRLVMARGWPRWGFWGKPEKFSKFFVRNEKLQFLIILMKILRFFEKFYEFSWIFRENLDNSLELCISRGLGWQVQKSIETSYFLKLFINYMRNFDFQELL